MKYQSNWITVLRIKRSEKLIKILAPLILGLQWWNKAELKVVCGAITGYFWYFKIFELTMEIRFHSDKSFQYLHQRHQWSLPPPFHILFLLLAIYQCLRVFQLTFWWILACLRSPSALSFHCCKWNLYLASSMCMVTTVTMLGAVALVNSNSKTCPSSHIFQISRMICYNSNHIRLNFNISIDKRINISHDKYAQLGTALSHCVKILFEPCFKTNIWFAPHEQ